MGKIGFIFAGEFDVGALFFMNPEAIAYLDQSGGFSIGAGPSLTVVDKGFAGTMDTNTLHKDIYAFVYGEEGLMSGIGPSGSNITRYRPSE